MLIHFKADGDDITKDFIILVDGERQLVRVMLPMHFNVTEDKRVEGAIATCMVNYRLSDGSFDYDVTGGKIAFRMTASFRESPWMGRSST